jgi:lysophospholipase L1-like esterase
MTDAYAAYNSLVTNLNAALETTVIPAASSTIIVVDPRDHGWTGSGYSTDGVHPNDAGEQALSDAIESGIRSAL